MNILFAAKLPIEGFDTLSEHQLIMPENREFTRAELLERLPDADAFVPVYTYQGVDADLMDAAPKLKIIATFGVGYNNIDIQAARQRFIAVTNTPAPVVEPTAEQTFTLLLAVAHRTAELDRKIRTGEVEFGVMTNLGVGIHGKTLGIIGMGRIGQAIARRAVACGMNIIYHNRKRLNEYVEQQYHAKYVGFDDLLRTADVVMPMMPYSPEVHHLIDTPQFEKMKRGAILINSSRGAVINEKELARFLKEGHLFGAGLDVFEFEPNITEELLTLDNVVMSPHIGTGSVEGRLAMCRCVADNISGFFAKKEGIDWVVRPEKSR